MQTNLGVVKKSEQQLGKFWGYSRPSKTYEKIGKDGKTVEASLSTDAIEPCKLQVWFPFETKNFSFASKPDSVKLVIKSWVDSGGTIDFDFYENQELKNSVVFGYWDCFRDFKGGFSIKPELKIQKIFDLLSWVQRLSMGTNKFKKITEKVMSITNSTCVYDVEKIFDILISSDLEFQLFNKSNPSLGYEYGIQVKKPIKIFFTTATGMSVVKNDTLVLVVLYDDGKYLVNRPSCVPNLL